MRLITSSYKTVAGFFYYQSFHFHMLKDNSIIRKIEFKRNVSVPKVFRPKRRCSVTLVFPSAHGTKWIFFFYFSFFISHLIFLRFYSPIQSPTRGSIPTMFYIEKEIAAAGISNEISTNFGGCKKISAARERASCFLSGKEIVCSNFCVCELLASI